MPDRTSPCLAIPAELGPVKAANALPETGGEHLPLKPIPPETMSIIVVSPNEAYRSTLLAVLIDNGLNACAAFVGPEGGAPDASLTLEPQVVVVDGSRITDVPAARRTWPQAWLICSLDYLEDWECVRSLGADICVLKDRGLPVILEAVTQKTS